MNAKEEEQGGPREPSSALTEAVDEMTQANEEADRGGDRSDEDTVELVVLEMDQAVFGDGDEPGPRVPPSQVFTWLKHMESELDRLHGQWSQLDAELGEREARIAELCASLDGARDEITQLQKSGERVRAERDELTWRCAQLTRTEHGLLGKIQDLEAYIDGRNKEWAEENAQLTQYCNELAEARSRELASLRAELERRDLMIAELHETVASGQRTIADLGERQSGHVGRIADLEGALDQHAQNLERLVTELEEHRQRSVALEAQLEERSNAAEAFAADAQQKGRDLGAARRALAAQQAEVRRLEAEIDERRHAMSLLDKNVRRINILGTNLKRVERRDKPSFERVSPAEDHGRSAESNVHYIGSPDSAPGTPRKMLVTLDGQGNTTFPLYKKNTTIGRSRRSDIRIDGQFVSRIHARLLTRSIGTVIEDLGSKNGVLVNSEPVTRRVLKDGDIVSLGGKLDFKYVELDV